jgi:hypothetical protein
MQDFKINPLSLPSLTLSDRLLLPRASGVYFVLCDEEVLYIGKARSLHLRWKGTAHHRLPQLIGVPGERIAWLSVDDAALCDEVERACIAHFAPPLNQAPVQRPQRQRNTSLRLAVHKLVARENLRRVEEGRDPLTQQDIAQGSGISQAVISTVLRNTATRLDLKTIGGLCNFFGVEPTALFDYDPD